MITKSMSAAVLAIAGAAAFLPSTTNAAIASADGDLILGFRATGGQNAGIAYLIDLGSAASILNSTVPITFSLGNIGGELTTLFGSWSTRGDVLWSVSGVQKSAGNGFPTNTMFATRSDAIDGPLGTATTAAWARQGSFAAGAPSNLLVSLRGQFSTGSTGSVFGTDQIESTVVPGALIQPATQPNSYASFQPGGTPSNSTATSAFKIFPDTNGIEGSFAQGPSLAVLDTYKLLVGSGPAEFTGNFSISNSAVVTYTPAGVVPEPTAGISMIIGAAILGGFRRRNGNRPSQD